MNARIILGVLLAMVAFVPGCQCAQQIAKGWQSQTSGLQRKVTIYDYNGHAIGSWRANTVIDIDTSQQVTFMDSTGARILIHGGILVAEEGR